MNLLDVFASWRQSLSIFEKKNFKLFLLVSLKNLKTALPLVLRYGGPLLVADYALRRYLLPADLEWVAWLCFHILISFVMLLATRASLEPKNFAYFKKYTRRFLDVFLIITIPTVVYIGIIALLALASARFEYFVNPGQLLSGDVVALVVLFTPLLIPVLTLSGYFVLDTNGGLRSALASLNRGMRALVYYLPVLAVFGFFGLFAFEVFELLPFTTGIFEMLGGGQSIFTHLVVMPLGYLLKTILHLFYFSLMANYYLKLKHGNYKLFFTQ